jgi:excisionase family DNA binding protein
MTIQETAERIRVSCRTVRRLIDERQIGFVRVGSRILITPPAVENFLARNYHPPINAAEEARKILTGRVSIGLNKK